MRLLIALLFVANAFAIPQLINYQGQLADDGGAPLDTTVAMTFGIYDALTGGTQVWMETHPSVSVENGIFNVLLGSVTTLTDAFSVNRWLGITVGADTEMIPRHQLVSVAHAYRVGTVDGASGGTISGKLNAGSNNTNAGTFAFVAGQNNHSRGNFSVISGGGGASAIDSNSATGDQSTVSGGQRNKASGTKSVVGGGYTNVASGFYGTVAGGSNNSAGATGATVGGGTSNSASQTAATVAGGNNNDVDGIGGTVGGGDGHNVNDSYSTISGGEDNTIESAYSTIAGGGDCIIDEDYGFIGGGEFNSIYGVSSVIAGGYLNTIEGDYSFIGGGSENTAAGSFACVAGGDSNDATGSFSFAAGRRAKALHSGSFVWSDATGTDFSSQHWPNSANTFNVRCSGGVVFYTNTSLTAGMYLNPGGSSWISACDSTKKHRISLTDTKTILEKVARLPVKDWEYKAEAENTRHIGPMAQDFWNAFHLGSDSLGIATIDADGVLFAAVQELAKQNQSKDKKIADLESRIQSLEQAILQFGTNNLQHKQ